MSGHLATAGAEGNDVELFGVRIESVLRLEDEILLVMEAEEGFQLVGGEIFSFEVAEPMSIAIRSNGQPFAFDRFVEHLEDLRQQRTELQLSSAPNKILALSYREDSRVQQIGLPGTRIAFDHGETPLEGDLW